MTQDLQKKSIAALSVKLSTAVVAMFIFAIWIMPPLYDAFCDITGLNGKTSGRYETVSADVDKSRTITVQFLATNNESMPWEFGPQLRSIKVHPGAETLVNYLAKNNSGRDMVAQAIPSLVPFKAAEYFHKTECFCFNQQPLAAGAAAELPLSFIVDIDIPRQIHTITLSYTLFDITPDDSKDKGLSKKLKQELTKELNEDLESEKQRALALAN